MKYLYALLLLVLPNVAFAKSLQHHHFHKIVKHHRTNTAIPYSVSYRKQKSCFIHAMLMETRGVKSHRARVEVGRVIFSRLINSHFPNTVCAVYYQKHLYSHKRVCEFSDVCHRHHKKPFTKEDYAVAKSDMYDSVRLMYKLGPTPYIYFTSGNKCPVIADKRKRIGPFLFCKPKHQLT